MNRSIEDINSEKNQNLENIIRHTTYVIKSVKKLHDIGKRAFNNSPIQIKILNIITPLIFVYIFTIIIYNLPLSIISAFLEFLILFLINKPLSFLFIGVYIFINIGISMHKIKTLGRPILKTDIIKNKEPYRCDNNSLTIENNKLEQDLYGGYFTYSYWLYVNGNIESKVNWNNYRYNEWKSIFYRGTPIDSSGDLSGLIQFPGFWLTPVLNNLVIVFQNGSYVERLELDNIPFNTWMNIVVVVETKSVSIYVNGLLDRTLSLYQSISIMNGYNLYLTSDLKTSKNQNQCGFAGYLAELIYYNFALKPIDILKSYTYYKKIINNYELKQIKNNYVLPDIITNSDYL
jgi:hypothetical protein